MPIYEFYCKNCHTIYQFLSRSVNTEKIPNCPICNEVKLKRVASTFATISGGKSDDGGDDIPDFDEAKMEKAMAVLAKEADKINEDDPRQAAQLMRKLSQETGLNLGPKMEEALSRMERGEDPDKIEEEMGDLLDDEEPFLLEERKRKISTKAKVKRDDTLYDL